MCDEARLLVVVLVATAAHGEPRTWTLDDQTARVRFVVDAPWDCIRGLSSGVRGSVSLAEESWSDVAGRIRVDLATFTTGLSLRDEDLRDQFFEISLYPEATLSITGVKNTSTGALTADVDAQGEAVGTLSLHGQTQPVRIPVFVRLSESGGERSIRVRGKFEVPLASYGLRRPERLLMKVGEVAQVSLEATFRARTPASLSHDIAAAISLSASITKAAGREASRPEAGVVVAFRRKTETGTSWEYSFTTPEGRGERLFFDPSTGGESNALSCAGCHSVGEDLRTVMKPAAPLRNRAVSWRGFVDTLEQGIDICVRKFMLRPEGASPASLSDLAAYIRRASPEAAPPLDYSGVVRAGLTAIDRPTGGDAKRGEGLTAFYCFQCHNEHAQVRSPLTRGLYEADDLVRRIRWIDGHDARQMPPIGLDRLKDEELRDIVTYLVGDESKRIFNRRPRPVPGSTGNVSKQSP